MSSRWAMGVLNPDGRLDLDHPDEYVKSYDLDAFDGVGMVVFTHDLAEAMTWDTPRELLAAWMQQSTVLPIRPNDGRPNRPLSALSVTPVELS